MPKTFVLLQGQSGLMGKIWHTEQVSGEGKEKLSPVFKYDIPEGDNSTLSELIERFKDHATQN